MDEFDDLKRSVFFPFILNFALLQWSRNFLWYFSGTCNSLSFLRRVFDFFLHPIFFCVLWLSLQVLFYHVIYCRVFVIYCIVVLCTYSFTV